MSDGKWDEKVSSSSCPPSADDLVKRVESTGSGYDEGSGWKSGYDEGSGWKSGYDEGSGWKHLMRVPIEPIPDSSKEWLLKRMHESKKTDPHWKKTWLPVLMALNIPDKKSGGTLMHPSFEKLMKDLDLDLNILLSLADEDHHGAPPKLEAPIKMEWEDEDHPGESSKLEVPMKTEGKETVSVVLGDEVWEIDEPKPKSPPRRMQMEVGEVDLSTMQGPKEPELEELEELEPDDQPHWITVEEYRIHWDEQWSGYCGSFEDTTRIPPMRFTDNAEAVDTAYIQGDTLQVYQVKLAATKGNLQLPLDVFGMVAVRDPIDHNRNIIFRRKRDECHTLTEKDPYLVLEGPTRAVMFSDAWSDPVIIEVDLKVKGASESKDEQLSYLVAPLTCSGMFSRVFKCAYTSKVSRLEFTLGHIVASVEATIFVRVMHGSWPDGLRGLFTASTTGFTDRSTSGFSVGVGHERIILLDSGDQGVAVVAGDGKIKLSRNVISAEHVGQVIFHVKALEDDVKVVEKDIIFHPLEENKSISELDIGFCKMEVTVFWSLVSYYD